MVRDYDYPPKQRDPQFDWFFVVFWIAATVLSAVIFLVALL